MPEPWVEGLDEAGELRYFNPQTRQTLHEHPLDAHYRELYAEPLQPAVTPSPS